MSIKRKERKEEIIKSLLFFYYYYKRGRIKEKITKAEKINKNIPFCAAIHVSFIASPPPFFIQDFMLTYVSQMMHGER